MKLHNPSTVHCHAVSISKVDKMTSRVNSRSLLHLRMPEGIAGESKEPGQHIVDYRLLKKYAHLGQRALSSAS